MIGENLLNLRMQSASVKAGVDLMARHAATTGLDYHAVARMRADLGDPGFGHGDRDHLFLNLAGWKTLRRRSNLLLRGKLTARMAEEVVVCVHPRYKHSDFCHWSVPPAPLQRTVEQLVGSSFDALVYHGAGLGSKHADCAAYLNSTDETQTPPKTRIPLVSENIYYCAMRAARARPSQLVDVRSGVV